MLNGKCLLFFVFLNVLFSIFIFSKKEYISEFNIQYNENNYPFINILIEEMEFPTELNLGSRFSLTLPSQTLEKISKTFIEMTEVHDILGNKFSLPTYVVPKVKIGNLTLKNLNIREASEGKSGQIGKLLGRTYNLLVDFPSSKIIACDSFSTLKKKNLIDGDWISVPFQINSAGIVVNATTDFDNLRLLITTSSDYSVIDSDQVDNNRWAMTNKLSIGKREFRTQEFYRHKFPSTVSEFADGLLGLDFIDKNPFYIDYTHKLIYFKSDSKDAQHAHVTYNENSIPFVEVCVNQKPYLFELDLGSCAPFAASTRIIKEIENELVGVTRLTNIFGDQYDADIYKVNSISIGEMIFKNPILREDKKEFHTTVDKSHIDHIWGSVGYSILEHYDMFFDFLKSSVYFCKDLSTLKAQGIFSDNNLEVPFELCNEGLIVGIETEYGLIKFLVDTGCTAVGIMGHSYSEFKTFKLQGYDFGPQKLFSLKDNFFKDFEGVLGMDFLMKYPFYIDYPNKKIIFDLG